MYFTKLALIALSVGLLGALPGSRTNVVRIIRSVSTKADVSPANLYRVAYVESKLDADAFRVNKNATYDIGVFQINSIHWHTTCKEFNVFNTRGNTECAAKIIRGHRRHKDKDPYWLGRYHSKTPSRKMQYYRKLQKVSVEGI